jgi:Holliday junction DNA helicase RuvB
MDDERLIASGFHQAEDEAERTLRPLTLAEYFGQHKLKESLSFVYMQAAVARREPLDHLLLYGPPGLGKTTLAGIIASEMGHNIRVTSGPAIERPGDLASILTNLAAGTSCSSTKSTGSPTPWRKCSTPPWRLRAGHHDRQGPIGPVDRLDLPRFTLIGATTRAGLLTSPLRDRFGISFRLELYEPEDLSIILMRSAKILRIACDPEGARWRSRGAPAARPASPIGDQARARLCRGQG